MKKPCEAPVSVTNRQINTGRFFWLLALLLAIVAFTQLPAYAQFASGSIGATVTDATGALIPAAKAVLKNRSEERRVGKECRSRRWPYHLKKRLDRELERRPHALRLETERRRDPCHGV